MFKKILVIAIAVVAMSAVTAMACGNEKSSSAEKTGSTGAMINSSAPEDVVLTGVLTCSTCALKAEGARSSCSKFGCSQALKTDDGRLIGLMQNKFSANLVTNEENRNKPVEVTGTFFANANMLDVKSYTLDGGKTVTWCDRCKGMDACMADLGDSH
jgi:hypothetical protein